MKVLESTFVSENKPGNLLLIQIGSLTQIGSMPGMHPDLTTIGIYTEHTFNVFPSKLKVYC
jgi:hypothetical protein